MDVHRNRLVNWRELAIGKGETSIIKRLTDILLEYDRDFKMLLRDYGEYNEDLGQYFVSDQSEDYDEFHKKWSHLASIKENINDELVEEIQEKVLKS